MSQARFSLTLIVQIVLFGKAISCPLHCICYSEIVLDCKEQGLEEFPSNLPSQLELLDLNDNKITSLFPLAFQDLPKLNYIMLENNQLQQLDGNALKNLPALQFVILQNNLLTNVDLNFITELEHLEFLDLTNNAITLVNADQLKPRPRPLIIDVRGNPLDCCKITFKVSNISMKGHCHYPIEMYGISIEYLHAAQLICSEPQINSSNVDKKMIPVIFTLFASIIYVVEKLREFW